MEDVFARRGILTMKTLPTCLCILGFATASLAGGSVLLAQIGADDGTDIDITNMLANQIFEVLEPMVE